MNPAQLPDSGLVRNYSTGIKVQKIPANLAFALSTKSP
jgi:hypothetical protein